MIGERELSGLAKVKDRGDSLQPTGKRERWLFAGRCWPVSTSQWDEAGGWREIRTTSDGDERNRLWPSCR